MQWSGIPGLFGGRLGRRYLQQSAAERQLRGAMAVGEEAVVADAMKAIRQGVQEKAEGRSACVGSLKFVIRCSSSPRASG